MAPERRVAATTRGPCAICDQTNATMRLCAACRADPANAGWNESTLQGDRAFLAAPPAIPEDDRHAGDLAARERLAEARDRRLRAVHPRTQQILQLVGFYSIVDYRRPEGKARANCEWIAERRPLHLAEVAFLVGVTPTAVRRTLRRYERLMRAALGNAAAPSPRRAGSRSR